MCARDSPIKDTDLDYEIKFSFPLVDVCICPQLITTQFENIIGSGDVCYNLLVHNR